MIKFLIAKGFNVKEPKFDFEENAGIDFYTPSYNETFENWFHKDGMNKGLEVTSSNGGEDIIRIPPHGQAIIPSGVYSQFPNNIALTSVAKSGVCTKQCLVPGARLIDTSYQGMIFINVVNWSNEWTTVKMGEKIAQFVPYLIDTDGCLVYTEDDLSKEEFFGSPSKRGDGKFGSTGVK